MKTVPLATKNYILFGSYDHIFYCIDVEKGIEVWSTNICEASFKCSPILLNGNKVILGSLNGTVCCLEIKTGEINWKIQLPGPIFGTPSLSKNGIIFTTAKGSVHCLEVEIGVEIWRYHCDSPIFGSVLHHPELNLIFFGCQDGRMNCLTMKGEFMWTVKHSDRVIATPVIIKQNKDIFIMSISSDGQMSLTNFKGRIVGQVKLDLAGETFCTPAVLNNKIIMGCRDDFVHCIKFSLS